MQITNFKIKDRTIYRMNNIKLIGVVGQDTFKVFFVDEEWSGLHKTMKIIRSDGKIVKLALLNDSVVLTDECYIEGEAKLGFYGTINEDDPEEMEIASTDYITITFLEHAYDNKDGIAITEPTPSQWDIIVGQLNDIIDEISDMKTEIEVEVADIEEKLENGDFDGRGIVDISKISTVGAVDTYEILYTDNTSSYFTVTNGGIQVEEDPTVPSYVKAITENDISGWDAKPTTQEMNDAIAQAIGGIVGIEYQVVAELPQTGESGVIYLISNEGEGQNVYDEYIWIASESDYEMIGTTEVDLSNYYNKTQTDNLLSGKVDKTGDTMTGNLATTGLTVGTRASGSVFGLNSVAEGINNVASGEYSHAEGYETAATGFSHSEGRGTETLGGAQHVEGMYNVIDTQNTNVTGNHYIHIAGNGLNNNAKSNAHTLDWDGNAWFAGDVYVGSTSGTNKDAGSIKLVKEQPGIFFVEISELFAIDFNSSKTLSQTDAAKLLDLVNYKIQNPERAVVLFLRNTTTSYTSSDPVATLILSTNNKYKSTHSSIELCNIYNCSLQRNPNRSDKFYLNIQFNAVNGVVTSINSATLNRTERVELEKTSNKVTTISANSTDTEYPSALAVKNYVDSQISGAIGGVY